MHKSLLTGLGLALLLGTTLSAAADEASTWRLFVADHAEPLVTAIDLDSGEAIGRFDLAGPAALYATTSKAGVYAVQTGANQVAATSSVERCTRSASALPDNAW